MSSTGRKMPVILVGAGFAGFTHWIPGLSHSNWFELIGVVDPLKKHLRRAARVAPNIWTAAGTRYLPPIDTKTTAIFVATPDHFGIVREYANLGLKKFIVEHPLVSRDTEISKLEKIIAAENLVIYAIDHYHQKLFPLEFIIGRSPEKNLRQWIHFKGDHNIKRIPGSLGKIEGLTYTNIEAGELGIPYLDKHPWVERDKEIGGILRDLGSHTFNALIRLGLTSDNATIMDVGLSKLDSSRKNFLPVKRKNEIEMWARTLLVWNQTTANIAIGKAPFPGKERSLAVRGKRGIFFCGLGRGQPSVLMTTDGKTTRMSLVKSENDLVLEEAAAFFQKRTPKNFDGNVNAALRCLRLIKKIKTHYRAV